jgi:hypothetical protein
MWVIPSSSKPANVGCDAFRVAGSFVDYSVPYTQDCRLIHNAMQLALQQERQRDAAAAKSSTDASI